jgi:hypothetical protein
MPAYLPVKPFPHGAAHGTLPSLALCLGKIQLVEDAIGLCGS